MVHTVLVQVGLDTDQMYMLDMQLVQSDCLRVQPHTVRMMSVLLLVVLVRWDMLYMQSVH